MTAICKVTVSCSHVHLSSCWHQKVSDRSCHVQVAWASNAERDWRGLRGSRPYLGDVTGEPGGEGGKSKVGAFSDTFPPSPPQGWLLDSRAGTPDISAHVQGILVKKTKLASPAKSPETATNQSPLANSGAKLVEIELHCRPKSKNSIKPRPKLVAEEGDQSEGQHRQSTQEEAEHAAIMLRPGLGKPVAIPCQVGINGLPYSGTYQMRAPA